MMAEAMNVFVEVWPVAADPARIWLLDGDGPWISGPVASDNDPHSEVEYGLAEHSALADVILIHSTSWRVDRQSILLTYMAVLGIGEQLVLDRWAEARPVSAELVNTVGKPISHGPTEAPWPRQIDVLFHGLRHLRHLLDTDSGNAAAFDRNWRAHLNRLSPELARMYLKGEVA
jgi:hypothetical protein